MFAGTHRELPQGSRLFGVFWCELLGSAKLLRTDVHTQDYSA